ncbi:MAG: hypothetical protein C4522_13085 [Desulfobacteraceae bacterium]|nr:MAG: hypothetical protein C4522_13085 [Desulfobacteraceae bacterium]
MASNFRVFTHRNGENVHIKLSGGFDGASANELLYILSRYTGNTEKIFIHTDGLSYVHSFGRDVFQSKCRLQKDLIPHLVFTGQAGSEMVLLGSRYIP